MCLAVAIILSAASATAIAAIAAIAAAIMSSTATAIAIRKAAETAVTNYVVRSIASTEYTDEEARNFRNDILQALLDVPSNVGGGEHGHTYLVESQEQHHKRTGTTTDYAEARKPPETATFANDSPKDIAEARAKHAAAFEAYHTQEGARAGARKLIVANAPKDILLEHWDEERGGFGGSDPRPMLATVMTGAIPRTVVDGSALCDTRDRKLTFDTAETLAVQFSKAAQAINQLTTLFSVTTCEAELKMKWMGSIEGEKEFEDQVEDWKRAEKTGSARKDGSTGTALKDFIEYFGARDTELRRLDKVRAQRGGQRGAVNAAREQDLEERIAQRVAADVNSKLADLAVAVEDQVYAAAEGGAPTSAPPAAEESAVLTLLKNMDARLQKLESGGGGGRRRRGDRNAGKDGDASAAATGERAPCKNCGAKHDLPDDECWKLEKNKDKRPAWYQKRLDRRSKKNGGAGE